MEETSEAEEVPVPHEETNGKMEALVLTDNGADSEVNLIES